MDSARLAQLHVLIRQAASRSIPNRLGKTIFCLLSIFLISIFYLLLVFLKLLFYRMELKSIFFRTEIKILIIFHKILKYCLIVER